MTGTLNLPPTEKDLVPTASTERSDPNVGAIVVDNKAGNTIHGTLLKGIVAPKMKKMNREALIRRPFKSPLKHARSTHKENQEEQDGEEAGRPPQGNSKKVRKESDSTASMPSSPLSSMPSPPLSSKPSMIGNSKNSSNTLGAVSSTIESHTAAALAGSATKTIHRHRRANPPFRSPVIQRGKSGNGGASSSRALSSPQGSPLEADKKAEIRALQYRIAELKSSIRNARLARKYQESEAGSLDALIAKWRQASRVAAERLVDQMVTYEEGVAAEDCYYLSSWVTSSVSPSPSSIRGSGSNSDGHDGSSSGTSQEQHRSSLFGRGDGSTTSETVCSPLASARDNPDDTEAPVENKGAKDIRGTLGNGDQQLLVNDESQLARLKSRARSAMLGERMGYQDPIVGPLPSKETLHQCHEYSDRYEEADTDKIRRKLPKMQRLLLGLKIDPELLGYNAVLDEFTEE